MDPRETVLYGLPKTALEGLSPRRCGGAAHVAQPLVAAGQQACQQSDEQVRAVPEMGEQNTRGRCRALVTPVDERKAAPCSVLVQVGNIVNHLHGGTKAGQQRHLPRQLAAQGVNGLDAQATRVVAE